MVLMPVFYFYICLFVFAAIHFAGHRAVHAIFGGDINFYRSYQCAAIVQIKREANSHN